MENTTIETMLETAKLATKMNLVKLDANFVGNAFNLTFRQGVEKGEKFDREKSEIYHTATYDLTQLPETLFIDCPASRHGLKQKLSDNLAMKAEVKLTTSVQDCVKLTDDLWTQLKEGNWNAVAQGGTKAPTIKLTDLEAKMLVAISAGLMDYDTANNLYKGITGKELSK